MWLYVIIGIPIFMTIFVVLFMPYLEKKTYSVEVFAEIVDYEEYATDAYGKMYVAVLKYSYNGEEYLVQDTNRKFREEDNRYKYDVLTLRIDPKRPEKYMVCTSMKDISVSISYRDKMVIIFSVATLGLMLLGKFAPIIAIYIFIGVAIIALITLIAKSSTTKWVELDAKIIATEKKAVKGGIMLFHIYEYEYEGKEYRSMSNVGSACGKGILDIELR